MSDLIDSIKKTRELTADIFVKSLVDLKDKSEFEIAQKILLEVKNHNEIFSEGWYSPPSFGVAVLLDSMPYKRLEYDSLRKPEFEPSHDIYFGKETVGMIFFSPIDKKTNMIGDIGFTVYNGTNKEIQNHLKNSYKAILDIAKHAKVGMTFDEVCSFADNRLKNNFKITRWITKNSIPEGMNFGHTIPGSYENINFGEFFEEIKSTITKGRIYIKENVNFKITETCAFTIESRLEDINNTNLPIAYFHFIVCFDNGKKTILENFENIFKIANMDYIYDK